MYKLKEDTTIKQTEKYSIGVQQLDSAQETVQELRKELMKLKPILEHKTAFAEETLKQIQKENADADETQNIVMIEQKLSAEQQKISEMIRKECKDSLAKALPDLYAAISALDTIKEMISI